MGMNVVKYTNLYKEIENANFNDNIDFDGSNITICSYEPKCKKLTNVVYKSHSGFQAIRIIDFDLKIMLTLFDSITRVS